MPRSVLGGADPGAAEADILLGNMRGDKVRSDGDQWRAQDPMRPREANLDAMVSKWR